MAKITFDANDFKKNRITAGLAYIIFFLPLLTCPRSALGKYTANHGLLLLIAFIGVTLVNALLSWIWILGGVISAACWIARVCLFAIAALGMYNVIVKNTVIELPFINHIQLIK